MAAMAFRAGPRRQSDLWTSPWRVLCCALEDRPAAAAGQPLEERGHCRSLYMLRRNDGGN